MDLIVNNLKTSFAKLTLAGRREGADWHIGAEASGITFDAARRAFRMLGEPLSGVRLDFRATAGIELSGSGTLPRKLAWGLDFSDLAFADAQERHLGEGVAGRWKGSAHHRDGAWSGTQSLRLNRGALLTPYLYLEPGASPIGVETRFRIDDAFERLRFDQSSYRQEGVLALHGSGDYHLTGGGGLVRLDLESEPSSLAALYQACLAPILGHTLLGEIDLGGSLQASLRLGARGPEALRLTLDEIDLVHRGGAEGLFALRGLEGVLNWDAAEATRESHIAWRGGHLFERIDLGGGRLPLKLSGQHLRMTAPSSLPVLDGALHLDSLEAEWGDGEAHAALSGFLTPISMELLSRAFGWPPMSGQLSGMIPSVRYADGLITVNGTSLMRVFDGEILIKDLVLEDLFRALPALSAEITLKSIDLEALTRTFSFGKITGRLDGTIEGLRLEDWEPVAFDARFATPEGDDSRHRISQRAVDNISNLGGAGVSGALSRSFLRFFEEFRYDRLGIRCRLKNGVCEMGGIESKDRGYYLVKGSGLPRIDIMGFNRQTDWNLLIEKLKQMTQGEAPVIE
ncbi:MAG: hypothetical protein B0D96_00360 [Candidatus Sedimenticola endophacoides]|nr:MAG: hypothetical protein B0D94_07560 [Candidatus Sedimenticola endophacoides]OQX38342.1 MAG: hypothetical protein B0D96_00360 [Candidatus Sedimenticola endophacoides]OQX41970.1 MAG: hypothetical protein B0D89_02500 [Candidatus Sedimenticola endophacoides]OQX47765.1 MAG: hypothetical protein B0D87_08720 [Candidatus Sedimenticola endophacoides]